MIKMLMVAAVVGAIFVSVFQMLTNQVLETRYARDFHVIEMNCSQGSAVDIVGLPMDSAAVVEKIDITESDGKLNVIVRTGWPRGDLKPDFRYHIEIPDSINSISFGNDEVEIWNRAQSKIPTSLSLSEDAFDHFEVSVALGGALGPSGEKILTGEKKITIEGELASETQSISHVKTMRAGDVLKIFVFSGEAGGVPDRTLLYNLFIPDDVNRIAFGPSEHVVWDRSR